MAETKKEATKKEETKKEETKKKEAEVDGEIDGVQTPNPISDSSKTEKE